MNTFAHLLKIDLDTILAQLGEDLELLRNRRLFLTGGTGFFGRWILESIAHANRELGLNLFVSILTRNPDAFCSRAPGLAQQPGFEFIEGDVRNFVMPDAEIDYIIHAATATGNEGRDNPLLLLDTIVEGTRRVLELAVKCRVKGFLFTSSGAVYGIQPPEMANIREDFAGAPDVLGATAAYGEGKRLAETLCSIFSSQYGVNAKIARCFAFIGPFLPLGGGYAAGNFLADAMAGRPVNIKGDGTPLRSYLYAADLVVWLFKILLHGQTVYPYNVGSEEAISIRELADAVAAAVTPGVPVEVAEAPDCGVLPQRYVPDVKRAASELGLRQTVDLRESISRTLKWYRGNDAF